MFKATQEARHLQRREGSFSTVPSSRGVNLLGWEEAEDLKPEEQRKCLGRRVGQIQLFLAAHKDLEGKERWKLVKEMNGLIERIRKIRPGNRPKELQQHFVDVARERMTRAEFTIWMNEAKQRANAAAAAGVCLTSPQ